MLRYHKFLTIVFFATATLLAAFSESYAQNEAEKPNYMLEILPTKKVIHVRESGLPGNTKLSEFLVIMPELLQGGDDGLFLNYEIQFDGKSTGSARDVILGTTWLGDVDKIEIISSPTVTQQKKGQGGVINIIPVKLKEGIGGNVSFDANTEFDAMPSFTLNYKKNKLELRGNLSLEYYNATKDRFYDTVTDTTITRSADTLWVKSYLETAKINMVYTFSERSKLKAWFWESVELDDEINKVYRDISPVNEISSKPSFIFIDGSKISELMNINARTEYEQALKRGGKFRVIAGYQNQNRSDWNDGKRSDRTDHLSPYDVDGEAKFQVPVTTITDGVGEIEAGMNTNYTADLSKTISNTAYNLSTFGTFKYTGDKFSLNCGVRYTFNKMTTTREKVGETFAKENHDFTGNVNVVWQMAPHNAWRLILSRNFLRPDMSMMDPSFVWQSEHNGWQKGNPLLESAYINTAELSYIFDWNKGNQKLMTHAGFRLDHSDGLFMPFQMFDTERNLFYTTYFNADKENIFNVNASMTYKVGIFSFVFAGNLFDSMTLGKEKTSNVYYNLNLSLLFRFRNKWTVSFYSQYCSESQMGNITIGDYFYSKAKVNKSFGKGWTVHLGLSDIFHYRRDNFFVREKGGYTVGTSDLYSRYVEFGVSYRFGTSL